MWVWISVSSSHDSEGFLFFLGFFFLQEDEKIRGQWGKE